MIIFNTIMIFILLIFIIVIFIKTNKPSENLKSVYDSDKNYMDRVDGFIRREVLFEIQKWLTSSSITVKNVSNNSPSIIEELSDGTIINDKTSKITIFIVTKMSKDLKNGFYRVYSKNLESVPIKSENGEVITDGLISYVGRAVYFYIRYMVVEITNMLHINTKNNLSVDNIIEDYILRLEREIYKINNINLETK